MAGLFMKSGLKKGQLIKWNDDRGFGFIWPTEGGREVFLHITAVKTTGRRPQVGDTIFYQVTTEADGKVRAVNALIQGVVSQVSATQESKVIPVKRRPPKPRLLTTVVGVGGMMIFALLNLESSPSRSPAPITAMTRPGCVIKGNVSISSGEKFYHVPGMEDYESTVITPEYGEKWFCTEAEATEAGWIRAPK